MYIMHCYYNVLRDYICVIREQSRDSSVAYENHDTLDVYRCTTDVVKGRCIAVSKD